MKTSTFVAAIGANAATANYVCPTTNGNSVEALVFGYKVQELMNAYYTSVPVNATFFSKLPKADQKGANGDTLAENTVANVEGLAKQAMIGSKATKEQAMKNMMALPKDQRATMPPECDYMMPATPDGLTHLKHAYFLEASMCGAFIGLAEYVQDPESAFLMARLAAEHGIHASAIRGMMQDVGFHANSTMLTPAFTTETVVSKSDDDEVGKLGKWLNGCAKAIMAPCGGSIEIGPLLSILDDQSMKSDGSCDSNSGSDSGGSSIASISSIIAAATSATVASMMPSGTSSVPAQSTGGSTPTPSRSSGNTSVQTSPVTVPGTGAAGHLTPLSGVAAVIAVAFVALM